MFRFIPSKAAEGLDRRAWLEPAERSEDPWSGAAPLCSWAGSLTRIKALSISKHYVISWESGVWWEISPFGFTRLARTVGSVGLWIRATAADGVCCARVPAHPEGNRGGVGVQACSLLPSRAQDSGHSRDVPDGALWGSLCGRKLCRATPFKTHRVNPHGIGELSPAMMHWFQVLTIHLRKGRDIPGAMRDTSEQNPSGSFQNRRSAYERLGQKVPVPLLRPPGHRGL